MTSDDSRHDTYLSRFIHWPSSHITSVDNADDCCQCYRYCSSLASNHMRIVWRVSSTYLQNSGMSTPARGVFSVKRSIASAQCCSKLIEFLRRYFHSWQLTDWTIAWGKDIASFIAQRYASMYMLSTCLSITVELPYMYIREGTDWEFLTKSADWATVGSH